MIEKLDSNTQMETAFSSHSTLATRPIHRMNEEASYICASCGEEVVIPVDPTQGRVQQYVEDCPVCCCPMVIQVEILPDGEIHCQADRE